MRDFIDLAPWQIMSWSSKLTVRVDILCSRADAPVHPLLLGEALQHRLRRLLPSHIEVAGCTSFDQLVKLHPELCDGASARDAAAFADAMHGYRCVCYPLPEYWGAFHTQPRQTTSMYSWSTEQHF
jgi:hypothetical protein